MSSISRKLKKNKSINIRMNMKWKCYKCGYEKLIPREEFSKLTNETFKTSTMFFCKNCNIRMEPISIEVDY